MSHTVIKSIAPHSPMHRKAAPGDRLVSVNGNAKLAEIAARNRDSISGKVLAEELTEGKDFAVAKEWNVNGEKAIIAIEKI